MHSILNNQFDTTVISSEMCKFKVTIQSLNLTDALHFKS